MFLSRVLHVMALQITVLVLCRADALAIGMLAATLTRGENPVISVAQNTRTLYVALGILSLGVVALWMFSPQSTTLGMQSIGFTWMALFYVVILLLAVGYPESWFAGIFRNKFLRELGVVSYCVYIIHIVVNVVLHALLLHKGRAFLQGKAQS